MKNTPPPFIYLHDYGSVNMNHIVSIKETERECDDAPILCCEMHLSDGTTLYGVSGRHSNESLFDCKPDIFANASASDWKEIFDDVSFSDTSYSEEDLRFAAKLIKGDDHG